MGFLLHSETEIANGMRCHAKHRHGKIRRPYTAEEALTRGPIAVIGAQLGREICVPWRIIVGVTPHRPCKAINMEEHAAENFAPVELQFVCMPTRRLERTKAGV